MAYDRDSFLAGVAVGRNMLGWPDMQGYGKNFFAFTIKTVADSFTYQFGLMFYGTIYWGDGLSEDYAQNPGRYRVSHVYATAGIYQIRIIGYFQEIMLGNAIGTSPQTPFQSAMRLISVDTPFPVFSTSTGILQYVSLNNCFRNCQRLKQIPRNLFANYKANGTIITGLARMFDTCTDLAKIPEKLFDGLVFADSFSANSSPVSMFSTCFALTELPEDIFSNPGFERVTSVENMFANCRSLVRLPQHLPFKSATDFDGFCVYCYALEEIPPGAFDLCESAMYFNQAFNGCKMLREIPAGLFAACDLHDLALCFLSCESLTTIGAGAFTNHPNLTNLEAAFEASGITEIPQGMFDGCTGIQTVESCFDVCRSLETVASDLFSDSHNIDDFGSCFEDCAMITSSVPEFWVRYPNARYHSRCFTRCINASNYEDIPQDWGGPT